MPLTRANMYYSNYSWTTQYTNDDPRIKGEPDKTLLSRTEGWEMLYFINKLAEKWSWKEPINLRSFHLIERTIKEYVPSSIRSQAGVKEWIEQNHKAIWDKIVF